MQVVELTFKTTTANPESDIDLIQTLLGSWRQRGQILGREHPLACRGATYAVSVVLPEPDALNQRHDCPYTQSSRDRLRAAGFKPPVIRPLEPAATDASAPCACTKRSHFILYTTYVRTASCLSCGDCFHPVPLYRVPYEQSTPSKGALHDRLMNWQSNYQACDMLQMNCTVGERFGLSQLGSEGSALTRQGIAICQDIARLTSIPTFYYLHRWVRRSHAAKERQRRCPSCSGDWRLPRPYHLFDFKCDPCQLVSNMSP